MKNGIHLSEIGERGLISQVLKPLTKKGQWQYIVPPGDDAAILKNPKGLVLSVDGITEGVHFKSSWAARVKSIGKLSFGRALGWKAMGSALSDLASMGDVKNRWAMVFLGAPGHTKTHMLKDLQKGVLDYAKRYQVKVVGGDTVRSKVLTMAVAVGGDLKSKPLTRNGSKHNDYLCVAGTVGDAGVGLSILNGKKLSLDSKAKQAFVKAFFEHKPLFDVGRVLAKTKGVHGLIDLSDSVHESVELLMKRKKYCLDVNMNSLPTSALRDRYFPRERSLFSGGEDYALMFTADGKAVKSLRKKIQFSIIGRFHTGKTHIRYFLDGDQVDAPAIFEHF